MEAMNIARQVELFDKYKFAKAALNEDEKNFVIYVIALKTLLKLAKITIYFFQLV